MLSRYPIEIIHITNTRGKARFARLPLDPFLWKTNQFISIVPHTRPNGTEQISIQHFFIVRVSKRPSGAKLYSKILFLRSAGAQRVWANLYFFKIIFSAHPTTLPYCASLLGQDGSNELSHARIGPPSPNNSRTKHLLLYRCWIFGSGFSKQKHLFHV